MAGQDGWRLRWHAVGRRRLLGGYLLAVLGTAVMSSLLTLAPGLRGLPVQTLLMLTVVVATALVGGLLPAVVAALVGGLLLNLLFVDPVGTLAVADAQNAAAIFLFVLIGVAVSSVVDLAARQAEQARLARREADRLGQLAQQLLVTGDDLTAVLEQACRSTGMTGAAVWRTDPDGSFHVEDHWGAPVDPTGPNRVVAALDDDAVLVLAGPPLRRADRTLLTAYAGHLRVLRDRRLAAAQARRTGALEEGNRTRTALLAAVSHDLRSPLATIKAAAGSLRDPELTWDAADQAELLETIEEGTDQMAHLVANLLDMSRLQTDTVRPLLTEVDLDEAVEAAVRLSGGPHDRIGWALPATLPPVWADPGLLERVLANLVENALRYAPGTAVRIEAGTVAGEDGPPVVDLRVVDHGPGIPVGKRDQLFLPFRRLGDAPDGQGLGLGLAVAHGLAQAMGADLRAGSTAGGGLTMTLRLPVAGAAA